jgi:diguanylate cyclase (GGDEF)-like protein
MESTNLLVTDKSPDTAEQINSLLRNSGIKIHIIHTKTGADVKRAIDSLSPALIIFANPDPKETTVEEISELAYQHSVAFAIYQDLEDPKWLLDTLKTNACFVINSADDEQLITAVGRLLRSSENDRNQAKQQQRTEELEHRYNLLLDSSRDAIAYIHEGLHVYANRAYLEALHVKDEAEITGLSLLEMMKAGETNLKNVFKALSKGSYPDEPLAVEVTRPDQSQFDANLVFSPARFNGEDCIQMMVQEQDAASELAAELDRMRVTDPLTQLFNKKAFTGLLEKAMSAGPRQGSVSAIFYLEPDGVEELQDDLDETGMDAFIADLGAVIRDCMWEADLAGRLSDHGFAILAQREDKQQLEKAAENILRKYRNHLVEIEDRSLSASCSIGLVTLGRLSMNPGEVLAQARKAFTEAAGKGNHLVSYRPQLTAVASTEDDRHWVDRIRFALNNHDFFTVQQPIVDLDGEGEHLVENLTFMREEEGDLTAAQFMPVAERNDLGGAIDRYIITELIKTFADSEERQIISLSNNSILDYGFPGWFANQLKEYCVEGDRIILQIAAASAHTNLNPAQRLMKELKPQGCHLAISSFDAERRSRQLLEHLDVSYVKFHQALTEDLVNNSASQDMIRRIVDAADPAGVSVIADEVADTASLAVLWQCGVKLIAGAFLKEASQVVGQ